MTSLIPHSGSVGTLGAHSASPSALRGPANAGEIPVWSGSRWEFRRYFYDPIALGAEGDGETDDTEIVQAAIDLAANGGVVMLPEGKSFLVDTLTLSDRCSIIGQGYDSQLKPKTGTTPVIDLNSANNCILYNFTIEADGVSDVTGIGGTGGTNLIVERVRTQNCEQGMAAVIGYLSQIRNCNLGGTLYGLHVQAGSVDAWIQDNEIYAGPYASESGSRSAIFEGGPLRIRGNHFHGSPGYNVFMFPASWVTFTENILEAGQLAGMRLQLASHYGDAGNYWDISHNFFTQLATDSVGLELVGYDSDQRIGDCIVDSNRFLSASATSGERMSYAVSVANAINILGANNIWRDQYDELTAVLTGANVTDVTITGG